MQEGKVYLIGAGPGDPSLITVRGIQYLAQADVVLYDALVHPHLLERCKETAELIFVGKRAGRASTRQNWINEQLAFHARAQKKVVRLKGGDPLLFGRGSEEAEYLYEHKIEFEIVPGVPSPIAASAYAGITLTHRSLASSVAYITATESDEKDASTHDWAKLATATQTLVIFMGVRKLALQMSLLEQNGRSKNTPVAVIQSASLPEQRIVTGTIETIAEKVDTANIQMPALTIVGEVVNTREALRWFERLPLFGKRVLVTRASEQASQLTDKLRTYGAYPIEAPLIRIMSLENRKPLHDAVNQIHQFDLIAFTSRNAIDHFFCAIDELQLDVRIFGGIHIAAVGPSTVASLKERGLHADLIPTSEYNGSSLAEQLRKGTYGTRILLPRARIADDTLPQLLREASMDVHCVAAYDTLPPTEEQAAMIRGYFEQKKVDAVLFTSSSTVKHLSDILGHDTKSLLKDVITASIGPSTTATAQKLGVTMTLTSHISTTDALVDNLVNWFSTQGTL